MTEGKKSVEIKAGIEPELKKAEKFEQQLAASVSKAIESAVSRAFEKALKGVGSKVQNAISDTVQRTPVARRTKMLTGAAYYSALRTDAVKIAEFRDYIRSKNPASATARKYSKASRRRREREDAFDNLDLSSLSAKEAQEDALWKAHDAYNYQKPDTNDYIDTPVSRALTRRNREDKQALKRLGRRIEVERNKEAREALRAERATEKEQTRQARLDAQEAKKKQKAQDAASPSYWREIAYQRAMKGVAQYQGGYSSTPPKVTPQIGEMLASAGVAPSAYQVTGPPGGGGGGGGGGPGGSGGGGGRTAGSMLRGYVKYKMTRAAVDTGASFVHAAGGNFGGGASMYLSGLAQLPLYGNLAARGAGMLNKFSEFNDLQNLAGKFRSSAGPTEALLSDSLLGFSGPGWMLQRGRSFTGIADARNRELIAKLTTEAGNLGNLYARPGASVLQAGGSAAEARGIALPQKDQISFLRRTAAAQQLGISPQAFGAMSSAAGGADSADSFITRMISTMSANGGRFATYGNFGKIAETAGGIAQAGIMGGYTPAGIGDLALVSQRDGNMLSSMNFEANLRDKGVALAAQGGGNYRETLYAMLATSTGQKALRAGGSIGLEAYGNMMRELETGEGLSQLPGAARKMFGGGVGGNLLSASVLGGTFSQREALLTATDRSASPRMFVDLQYAALLAGTQQFTPPITRQSATADNVATQALSSFEPTVHEDIKRNLTLSLDAAERFSKTAHEVAEAANFMLPSLLKLATALEDVVTDYIKRRTTFTTD